MTQQTLLNIIGNELTFDNFLKIQSEQFLFKNFYSGIKVEKLSHIQYPGRGRNSSGCGQFSKAYSCKCKAKFKVIQHTCFKLTCPICYQKGIYRASMKTTERFQKIKKLFLKSNVKFQLHHLSINSQWKIRTYTDFVERKKKLLSILKKERLHGVLIFHPWRKTKPQKVSMPWKTKPHLLKYVYKPRRLYYSPHFHFIGVVPKNFYKSSGCFYLRNGFTFTDISQKNYNRNKTNKPYLKSLKAVRRLLSYLLSHAGIIRGKHTITWFNQFSYNRMSKTNIREIVEESVCSHCNSYVYEILNKPIEFTGNFFKGFVWKFTLQIYLNRDKIRIERYEKYDIKYKGNMNIFHNIYIYE